MSILKFFFIIYGTVVQAAAKTCNAIDLFVTHDSVVETVLFTQCSYRVSGYVQIKCVSIDK